MKSIDASPLDGLRDALGQVIADQRREWRRERELIQAQAGQIIAELRAQNVELAAQLRAMVEERLALLRDGKDGLPGRDGAPGRDGIDGRDGVDGKNGRDGAPGQDGKDGSPGADGLPGRDGADGRQGADGKDGQEGAPGKDGADGNPGRDGIDGRDGADGKDGAPGEPGRDGVDGAPGRDGVDGRDGAPGLDGKDGAPGRDGVDGKEGLPGREGPPGKLPLVTEWTDRVYYESDAVTHEGSVYQAIRDTGRPPPHEDWRCIAAAGRNGEDGRTFRVRGTWSETAEYRALDVVALNGAGFVARRDQPGPCPGEGWQLIASQGKRGQPGERGPSGEKGDRGPPGPAVRSIQIDDQGLLILINSDGSRAECDFYPLLAKISQA